MFRSHDPIRDRIVAVKQFTLDLPLERRHHLVALFEQLIAADLSHHAIATPFATGLVDGSVYLAQESVSAESLDNVVREFRSFDLLLGASSGELESVEGVAEVRAKEIREGLRRLQEINLVDRYLQT